MRTLLLGLLCFASTFLSAQRNVTIKIIQTSDVHGSLLPFDFINNKAVDYGLAHVMTYVKQQRQNEEQEVILLDNGDILQGQPTVYFSNFIDTVGQHIVSRVMNHMDYDAATVGNHDIEAGPKIYDKLVNEFNFPWLSANIINTQTGLPYFKPYTVITRQGVRIAIMGLTTPGVTKWLSPTLWKNMEFRDMIESARIWMDSIMIKEKPHIVLGLFHAGHNPTFEGANPMAPLNENASRLVAEQVPGFDAVFIGHDHDKLIKWLVNTKGDSVLLLDPGSRAMQVSEANISISLNAKNETVKKRISGKLSETQGLVPDPHYVSTFSDISSQVEEFVDRRIGSISTTVSTRDAYFGPSTFLNLIHSLQLSITSSSVSFAAPLSFDVSIEQGPIYVRDLFKLYIYENLLYIISLTGQEIKDYLEFSYSLWYNTMTSENDNLILLRRDEKNNVFINNRGRAYLESSYYNFDSAAGIKYFVDVSKPAGQRVTIVSMEDGTTFDINKTYQVSLNSYRGMGGGGHLTVGVGLSDQEIRNRIIDTSPHDIRYYLLKWIEKSGKLQPVNSNNWEIVPSEWAKQAEPRDRLLLFGKE